MRCNHAQPEINALIDGELNAWSAARVRQHLKNCPACRADYDAAQRLSAQARAWRAVNAPAGLETRLAASLMGVSPPAAGRPRLPHWRPLAALAGVTAAAFLIALFVPGQVGRPRIAFADVQRAMQDIKTAHWMETEYTAEGNRRQQRRASDVWARLDPPAEAHRLIPASLHNSPGETTDETQSVIDRQGFSSYDVTSHRYTRIPMPFSPPPKGEADLNRRLRSIVQADLLLTVPLSRAETTQGHTLKSVTSNITVWHSTTRQVMLNDRAVARIDTGAHWPGGQTNTTTFFVDPQTRRLVRMEARQTRPRHPDWLMIRDRYEYNTTPPPGTFDLTPPPGVPVIVISPTRSGRPSEKGSLWREIPADLSAADRAQIERIVAQSHAAWLAGDWPKFAAVWDFDYFTTYRDAALKAHPDFTPLKTVTAAEHRHNWKTFVLEQRGRWQWWKTPHIVSISAIPSLHVFKVRASHEYQLKNSDKPIRADMTYYLHVTPRGWRIFSRGEI